MTLHEKLVQTGRLAVNNLRCHRGWCTAGCCALHAFGSYLKPCTLCVPRAQQYQLAAACEKQIFSHAEVWSEVGSEGRGGRRRLVHLGDVIFTRIQYVRQLVNSAHYSREHSPSNVWDDAPAL